MRELAASNFEVVLPGLTRKDEVGNIAKAVDEFKVRAAEKAQREAAEKAEQDRGAEAERQAALAKMADEFQTAVGDIVRAAAAGDFSRRVAGRGGARRRPGAASRWWLPKCAPWRNVRRKPPKTSRTSSPIRAARCSRVSNW